MPQPVPTHHKFLDPRVLAKISGLELRARLAVEGFRVGGHASPYQGVSVEFADHRSYVQGDDIRHVDWKLYARTDKYYIKQYEEETNLSCVLVVDCSASMGYQSPAAPMSKHDFAASVAASLAYLALQQGDAVGMALFDQAITHFIKPSSHPGHWKTLTGALARGPGPGKTGVRAVLDDLAERMGRRTLVIVISDLFDDPDETILGLKHLRYLKNDVIMCNVWDPAELTLPFDGPTLFDGLEGSGRLMVEPQAFRQRYTREVESFIASLRGQCRKMHVDFVPFDTSHGLDVAISAYLATRAARIRSRSSRVLGGG